MIVNKKSITEPETEYFIYVMDISKYILNNIYLHDMTIICLS